MTPGVEISPEVFYSALLNLSRGIADHGLTDVCQNLTSGADFDFDSDPSLLIFRACEKAIQLLRKHVLSSLRNLLHRRNSLWSLSHAVAAAAAAADITAPPFLLDSNTSSELGLVTNLEVRDGSYGRQAVATDTGSGVIPRGTLLLRECALATSPFPPATLASSSFSSMSTATTTTTASISALKTSENVYAPLPKNEPDLNTHDVLQVAHVHLALQIVHSRTNHSASFQNRRQQGQSPKSPNEEDGERGVETQDRAQATFGHFDYFMQHCRPPTLLQPHTEMATNWHLQKVAWKAALPSLVVMGIVSSLHALLLTISDTEFEYVTDVPLEEPVCTPQTETSAEAGCTCASIRGQNRESTLYVGVGLRLYEVLRRLPHNTHAISSIITTPVNAPLTSCSTTVNMTKTTIPPFQPLCQQFSSVCQTSHGLGLFVIASSLNHSCNANTVVKFHASGQKQKKDDRVVKNDSKEDRGSSCNLEGGKGGIEGGYCYVDLVASRDILSGEELCLSYGPTAVMPAAMRQRLLWEQYLFQCQCSLCVQQTPEGERQTVRFHDRASPEPNDAKNVMFHLEKACIPWARNMWFQIDNIRSGLSDESCATQAQLSIYGTRLRELLDEMDTKWSHLQTAEIKYCVSMSDTCQRHLLEIKYTICDICGQVFAYLADYSTALTFTRQGLDLYIHTQCTQQGLPLDDILVCREEVKVVQLLLACDRKSECKALAKKVLKNMRPFVHVHQDPDYITIQAILNSL